MARSPPPHPAAPSKNSCAPTDPPRFFQGLEKILLHFPSLGISRTRPTTRTRTILQSLGNPSEDFPILGAAPPFCRGVLRCGGLRPICDAGRANGRSKTAPLQPASIFPLLGKRSALAYSRAMSFRGLKKARDASRALLRKLSQQRWRQWRQSAPEHAAAAGMDGEIGRAHV